jgi:UDP-N-acetylglucosamine 2-epimerase (non-hydrolysing)
MPAHSLMKVTQNMKIMSIVGARPNFMKVASIARAVHKHNQGAGRPQIEHVILHTGQHYDEQMSKLFFRELEIPTPNYNLEVGSGSHAVQTAQIMERFEPVLLKEQPDVLVVVGDVNSTVACALVATKINYNGSSLRKRPLIAHIEAGLRSRDRDMPEEINRVLTDALSDLLFVTEEEAIANLEQEGIHGHKVHFVGNVMIDTLLCHLEKAKQHNTLSEILDAGSNPVLREKFREGGAPGYGLVTLHRPSNVDSPAALAALMQSIEKISAKIPLVFPLHPRTRNNLDKFGLARSMQDDRILYTEPLGYLQFLNLLRNAALVLTDSGGIQEEATFLGVQCITLRNNTERPVTVTLGTNYLVGTDPAKIEETAFSVIAGNKKAGSTPPFWDGKAGERIVDILADTVAKTE